MQTNKQSLIEAVINVSSGMVIAFSFTQLLAPILGIDISVSSNFVLTCVLTCASIIRSYLWRRYFTKRNKPNMANSKIHPSGISTMTEKLCYIEDNKAYFTTQELNEQWGDDWADTPYEYNAEPPYEKEGHTITTVMFSGNFNLPNAYCLNSPYSVEQINNGDIPWLRTEYTDPIGALFAGSSLTEFIKFIEQSGGSVYPLKKVE